MSLAKRKLWLIALIIVLLLIGGWLLKDRLFSNSQTINQTFTTQVQDFHEFFIQSVLLTEGEIDFETRLQLEGAVRNLNDQEILTAWNSFVNAPNDTEAQRELKELLLLLVRKGR